MAITVTEDLIRGSGMRITLDGATDERVFLVEGLPQADPDFVRGIAVGEVRNQKGVWIGTQHRGDPDLLVTNITTTPFGGNSREKMFVNAEYRPIGAVTVRINGNVVRDTTRFDVDGEVLKVRYVSNIQQRPFYGDTNQGDEELKEEPILLPGLTLEFDRAELEDPSNKSILYPGSINDFDWQGQQSDQWLCTDISSIATFIANEIPLWRVHYAFQFIGNGNNDNVLNTYNPVLFYVDRHTRRPPADVDPKADGFTGFMSSNAQLGKVYGNGWKMYQIYRELDFDELDLPQVFDEAVGRLDG
jgi:hypothetical protein